MGKMFFTRFNWVNETFHMLNHYNPLTGKNRDTGNEVDVLCLPPLLHPQAFPRTNRTKHGV